MSITISLQFPAGRYVAASWSDKNTVEWPPHPARLCLGLLDALHKAGEPADEREQLLWLCRQKPPILIVPSKTLITEALLDGVYVPQNPSNAESINASRKARSFPTVFLDSDEPTVFFQWPDIELSDNDFSCLSKLLGRVPRLGHSSSVVMVTLRKTPPDLSASWQCFSPISAELLRTPDFQLRVPWDGLIESAEAAFDAKGREDERLELVDRFLKAGTRLREGRTLKAAASPRGRHDPHHQWCGYSEVSSSETYRTPWDSHVLLLEKTSGTSLGLESIWQISETFHRTLIDRWSRNPSLGQIPAWLSGHSQRVGESGSTAPTSLPHLSIFPLAHVDAFVTHCDGHLLGLGLALPRPEIAGVSVPEFRITWRNALTALLNEDEQVELCPADKSWRWCLRPVSSVSPPKALRAKRWTGASCHWASVTPVILDQHPKPHFRKDPVKWEESCQNILRTSCARIGIQEPQKVMVSAHSALHGVPTSYSFEAPEKRLGRPARFHIHAILEFFEPVEGPLMLGSGRYRGYGLFMPLLQHSGSVIR